MKHVIFGESHGPAIGVVLTEVPSGIPVDEAFLAAEDGASLGAEESHGFSDISKSSDSIYDAWSEVGRCFHLPYKRFCVTAADLKADANQEIRTRLIKAYVEANSLDITAYQDFGWDPVYLYK